MQDIVFGFETQQAFCSAQLFLILKVWKVKNNAVLRYDSKSCKHALLQELELWDGKVPRKELMLHNAMQCTIPSCKMQQMLRKHAA